MSTMMKNMSTKKAKISFVAGWVVIGIFAVISLATLISKESTVFATKEPFHFATKDDAANAANAAAFEAQAATTEEVIFTDTTSSEPAEGVLAAETSTGSALNERWHFYNTDLQGNDDSLDDYNFGPNPMADVMMSSDALANAIKAKGYSGTVEIKDIVSGINPEDLDKDFRERIKNDPALGAADMAWFDSILGTDYLGVFYSECHEQWDATMNKAVEAWVKDEADYDATIASFEDFLNRATKVEIRYVSSGLTDQMYMNPATKSGVPKVIVMETTNHDGWFLVYTFTIKNTTTKEVMYRIDCGYQPTNVAEIMKVTPKANKNAKKTNKTTSTSNGTQGGGNGTPSGGDIPNGGDAPSGGGPSGGEDNPSPPPKPGSEPKFDKDPTKGTPVLPNDDTGPGTDTNNGVGAQYSTEDAPTNSNHQTPEEYQQAIQQLEDANATTREGGDSNTPSTPPPEASTVVDNNAANGTGYGGIDTPTPTEGSSVSNDSPGDSWDGLPE